MSVIFDAMLVLSMPDSDGIDELNRRLYEADTVRHQQFREINMDYVGGAKAFTTPVFAAAFNHFIPTDVEGCIRETSWRYPDWVLYVCDLGDYHQDEDEPLTAQTVKQLREASDDACAHV